MQLGMIGLGRMGANIVRRLMRDGHECIVYNRTPDKVKELQGEGAIGTTSLDDFVSKMLSAMRYKFGDHIEQHSWEGHPDEKRVDGGR